MISWEDQKPNLRIIFTVFKQKWPRQLNANCLKSELIIDVAPVLLLVLLVLVWCLNICSAQELTSLSGLDSMETDESLHFRAMSFSRSLVSLKMLLPLRVAKTN